MERKVLALIATVSLLLPLLISCASVATEVGSPIGAVIASGNPGENDWPMFGRNPFRTANGTVQVLINGSVWEKKDPVCGSGVAPFGPFPAQPNQAQFIGGWRNIPNPVVIHHPDLGWVVYYGSTDFYFYCLNARTGAVIWSTRIGYETNPDPNPGNYRDRVAQSTPVVAKNATGQYVAYIGTTGRVAWAQSIWPTGTVTALDALTGAVLWNVSTSNYIENVGPTTFNSSGYQWVYAGWSRERRTQTYQGKANQVTWSTDGGVVCLNASDGAVIWNFSVGKAIEYDPNLKSDENDTSWLGLPPTLQSSPHGGMVVRRGAAISDENVTLSSLLYVNAFNPRQAGALKKDHEGWIFAVNATDGNMTHGGWGLKLKSQQFSSPCVVGNVVYVGYMYPNFTGPQLLRYSAYNVSEINNYALGHCISYGGVLALNATTGSVIWNWTQGRRSAAVNGAPAYYDGKIFIGENSWNPLAETAQEDLWQVGFALCLNATTEALTVDQRLIWNYTVNGGIQSSPAVSGGIVYIADMGKDYVYALNANVTGIGVYKNVDNLIWNYKCRNDVKGSPAVAEADGRPIVYIMAMETRPGSANAGDDGICLYAIGQPDLPNVRADQVMFDQELGGGVRVFAPGLISGNMTVSNVGIEYQTFQARLYFGDYLVDRRVLYGVPALRAQTLFFSLNTTYLPVGTYQARIETTPVTNEVSTSDNVFIGPFLNILAPIAGYTYNWTTFNYNLNRTGATPSPGPKTNVTAWQFGAEGAVHKSMAVNKGVVYIGSDGELLMAVNQTTGAEIWRNTDFGGNVRTIAVAEHPNTSITPAGRRLRIYAGCADKILYCLRADTGATLWNYTGALDEINSNPAVITEGVKQYVIFGSLDGNLTCVEDYIATATTAEGRYVWSYNTTLGNAQPIGESSAVVGWLPNSKVVYIGSDGPVQPGANEPDTTSWLYFTNGTAIWYCAWVDPNKANYPATSPGSYTYIYNGTKSIRINTGDYDPVRDVCGAGNLGIGTTVFGTPMNFSDVTDSDFNVWAYLNGTAVATNASYRVYYPYFNVSIEYFNGTFYNTTTLGGLGSWTVSGSPQNNTWQQFTPDGKWYCTKLDNTTSRLNATLNLATIKSLLKYWNSANEQLTNITNFNVWYGAWPDANFSAVYGIGYQARNWTIYLDDVTVKDRTWSVETSPTVFCLNATATGVTPAARLIWNSTVPNSSCGGASPTVVYEPTLGGKVVYIGAGNDTFCLNATNGLWIWNSSTAAGAGGHTAAYKDGRVFFQCGSQPSSTLYALNAATGARIWTLLFAFTVDCSPVVSGDGIVYQGCNNGTFVALNESTGALLWYHKDTLGRQRRSVVLADGQAYVSTGNSVFALGVHIDQAPDMAIVGATPQIPYFSYTFAAFSYYGCKWNSTVPVLVQNQGNTTATITISVYYTDRYGAQNTTNINCTGQNPITITLAPGNATTLNFFWDIKGSVDPCKFNYTVGAKYYVPYILTANITTTVPGEIDTADNRKSGQIVVRWYGDATGDGWDDIYDLTSLGLNWQRGPKVGKTVGFDEMTDFTGDGICDVYDLTLLGLFWYKQAPAA